MEAQKIPPTTKALSAKKRYALSLQTKYYASKTSTAQQKECTDTRVNELALS